MSRFFVTLVLGVGIFALVAWQMGMFAGTAETAPLDPSGKPSAAVAPEKLGAVLYEAKEDVVLAPRQVTGRDPVPAYGHMNVLDKINVPSPVAGQLLFVGTEIPSEAVQIAGAAAFMGEDDYPAKINQGDYYLIQIYHQLYEGKIISADQMVGQVDPARALGELIKNKRKIVAAKQDEIAAGAAAAEADARKARADELFRQKTMSAEEWGTYKLAQVKYYQEYLAK